jgi:UDP-N-acetyl-D-galactosamine dehydrogenase
MGSYVASQLVKAMTKKRIQVDGAKILIMGLTFKENCPDLRNTRVIDIISELREYNCEVDVFDPWVNPEAANVEHGLTMIEKPENGKYDAIILAVSHKQFRDLSSGTIRGYSKPISIVYDLKYVLNPGDSDLRL